MADTEDLWWIACEPCLGLKPPRSGCQICEGRGEYRGHRPPPLPQAADSTPLNTAEKERGLAWTEVLREGHFGATPTLKGGEEGTPSR